MGRTKPGILFFALPALFAPPAAAQRAAVDSARVASMADHAMSGPMDANMMKHMELSPPRAPTRDDSLRARRVAADLKQAIAKYRDTAVAIADGYQMFLPNLKAQKVFHYTNYRRAFKEAFRFDAAQPTSLLYKRGDDGKLQLVGAMYTMPKSARLDRLDDSRERVRGQRPRDDLRRRPQTSVNAWLVGVS